MKIGVVYPQTELNGDPGGIDQIGKQAEALGFDHILMYDHVVGATHEERDPPIWKRGPYTDKHPFHDPLMSFAYLAGVCKKINFVTGILILPQRQTALVAKQVADLDLLSGGRFTLGVGIGWNYVEYDALGQNFKTRGKRLAEQIHLLRQLWSEPLVTFKGAFDVIDRANILPRPRRKIPILCGGFSDAAFKRAAHLADGFIFAAGHDEASLPGWQRVQHFLHEQGRSVEGFQAYQILQNADTKGLRPGAAIDVIRRWQDAGGTHASICTMGLGYTTIEEHIEHIVKVRHSLAGC